MHIEPGIVDGSKIVLSYVTAGSAGLYSLSLAWKHIKERGIGTLLGGTVISTALVFTFFQVFPHYPVGISEVHLILGSTLFLIFGVAPAAFGLALGLLIQGLFFAPFDLPQYGMNVTTLLVPLFALQFVARKVIAPETPYVQLKYRQALALSTTYQAGIVTWVAFWALYGEGFAGQTVASIATFGAAYMLVIVVEPIADLAVLAAAKSLHQLKDTAFLERRLYNPA
ncbi:ABC-type Co2+ transport system permease subunit [Mycobacterium frederiksbergense]|uniref:ABC-type Co2+ transport system permease subunit n=1 Tax=Mycolicibacterium frederiksbergense TaxID=117567 RepID=A0ABT6KV93_9MYCO|nr:energy-coupling factor ABC transporter permease [Mycolicibacterium frederiksbergense]MDH6194632.1 ABC-type Co2+ transport system permease subunit [Mycolicibacterium frederiksbergense]